MSDIAKCLDSLCPSKDYCHRFTAKPSTFCQSYGGFKRVGDEYKCDMFWANGICEYCHQKNDIHKMSCPTRKLQINL
jgi:hypothetical protein